MQQTFVIFIIILVVLVSILEAIASFVWYGVVSVWYFVSDYWVWGVLACIGLATLSSQKKKHRAFFSIVFATAAAWVLTDYWYISEADKNRAHATAEEIVKIYSHCELSGSARVTCILPASQVCSANVSQCADIVEEGLITWEKVLLKELFGTEYQNPRAYRALELDMREFIDNGGVYETYIQAPDGKNIILIKNTGGIGDYSVSSLM